MKKSYPRNFIKFLGTAGARFVMISQMRSSAGTWITLGDDNLIIDPGPGTLVRAAKSRPPLDLRKLDAVILTHKHLDHSGDLNVTVEAMTQGGWKKHGIVMAPSDAIDGDDPILSGYLKTFPEKIITMKQGGEYILENLKITTPIRLHHGVETYGLNIYNTLEDKYPLISLVSDTRSFPGLLDHFPGRLLILNTVLLDEIPGRDIEHLNFMELAGMLEGKKYDLVVLTHFGMNMLRARPWKLAEQLSNETGLKVTAASDGMLLDLDSFDKNIWKRK
ncbi:MAG: MBL fold metallo-hydrolase [Candidatus Eremiobacteraeota bacterium]|nr:MBL fold metallo-hydrolase [Candidatus Eremiobacteraeota bacterium]